MNKILIISGATASGKSGLATRIADRTKPAKEAVIINADSMQIYSELSILSAQPNAEDLKQHPHFLYSVLKHNQNSSLAIWLEMAKKAIDQALESEQLPIVVGGTGLYLSKLIDGISHIPEIDSDLKNQIRHLDKKELLENLQALGENLTEIESLDQQRLARRLEVLKQTGKNIVWWQNQPNQIFYPPENFVHLSIDLPREALYQNCNNRFGLMFKNGAPEEVERLLKLDVSDDSLITKTIGFDEISDYLAGKVDQKAAIELASQKTRNYAKRQLTWFRNQFKNKIVVGDGADLDSVFEKIMSDGQ